jgi:hypothetical protein
MVGVWVGDTNGNGYKDTMIRIENRIGLGIGNGNGDWDIGNRVGISGFRDWDFGIVMFWIGF